MSITFDSAADAASVPTGTDDGAGPAGHEPEIAFVRLTDIPLRTPVEHMSDPRMAEHMPLLRGPFTRDAAAALVAAKEACRTRDGLGHWAILLDGRYVGWVGLQREGDEWDLGLVLKAGGTLGGARVANEPG